MRQYINASIHQCINTSMHQYINASIHQCINASIHQYINASMHQYINTSIHPYIHTSIHPYIHTSIHSINHITNLYVIILTPSALYDVKVKYCCGTCAWNPCPYRGAVWVAEVTGRQHPYDWNLLVQDVPLRGRGVRSERGGLFVSWKK
jgi:hypothetical protein